MKPELPPAVTDDQLRRVGFTPNARYYPLTRAAVEWLCEFNGFDINQVNAAWWYAPNPSYQEMCEWKGKKRLKDLDKDYLTKMAQST